jgi:hypothetical protein
MFPTTVSAFQTTYPARNITWTQTEFRLHFETNPLCFSQRFLYQSWYLWQQGGLISINDPLTLGII